MIIMMIVVMVLLGAILAELVVRYYAHQYRATWHYR